MAGKEDLQRWWNGLSTEQRTDAFSSRDAGQLSDSMQSSLTEAGLIDQTDQTGRTMPDMVRQHLEEQGKGPWDQSDAAKMRH